MATTFSPNEFESARWVLTEALSQRSKANLCIIFDETTMEVGELFRLAANDCAANVFTVAASLERQCNISSDSDLQRQVTSSVSRSSRVILLQKLDPLLDAFRFFVIDQATKNAFGRVASMPGFQRSFLEYCAGNLDAVSTLCRLVADRLLWTSVAKLITKDKRGHEHTLFIPIRDHPPHMSPGRVPLGGWSNVPSGETFIVPDIHRAYGTVAVNGSFPQCVCQHDEEAILTIEKGILVRHAATSARVHDALVRTTIDDEGREVCENSSALAELGIGLNPAMTKLVGISTIDEKALGTVHIAFGRSTQFGHGLSCDMHTDLVITTPTLFLDHTLTIDAGRLALSDKDVFPDWTSIPEPHPALNSSIRRANSVLAEVPSNSGMMKLLRSWTTSRSGATPFNTPIGNDETARIAANIFWALPATQDEISAARLFADIEGSIPSGSFLPTLKLMQLFGIVEAQE